MAKKQHTPYITVRYDKYLTDITKNSDDETSYTKHFKDGHIEEARLEDTVLDVVGMYAEYLATGGRCKTIPLLNDPTPLFANHYKNKQPLLNAAQTDDCLSQLTIAMREYNNKKCNNIEPAYGLGIMIYLLVNSYYNPKHPEIYVRLYKLISCGLYALQLKRKPVALYAYKGLYQNWDAAKMIHDKRFSSPNGKLRGGFNNVRTNKDLMYDPIHIYSLYPDNMRYYSIDNIMLSFITVRLIIGIQEESGNTAYKSEEAQHYRWLYDMLYTFIEDICPQYIKYSNELIKDRKHENLDAYTEMYRFYKKNLTDDIIAACPALACSMVEFGGQFEEEFAISKNIYTALTGMPLKKLDLDSPIMYGRNIYEAEKEEKEDKLKICAIKIFVISILAVFGALIWAFISWLGAFAVPLILLTLLSLPRELSKDGSSSNDSGFVINMSTGHMECVWWV